MRLRKALGRRGHWRKLFPQGTKDFHGEIHLVRPANCSPATWVFTFGIFCTDLCTPFYFFLPSSSLRKRFYVRGETNFNSETDSARLAFEKSMEPPESYDNDGAGETRSPGRGPPWCLEIWRPPIRGIRNSYPPNLDWEPWSSFRYGKFLSPIRSTNGFRLPASVVFGH